MDPGRTREETEGCRTSRFVLGPMGTRDAWWNRQMPALPFRRSEPGPEVEARSRPGRPTSQESLARSIPFGAGRTPSPEDLQLRQQERRTCTGYTNLPETHSFTSWEERPRGVFAPGSVMHRLASDSPGYRGCRPSSWKG